MRKGKKGDERLTFEMCDKRVGGSFGLREKERQTFTLNNIVKALIMIESPQ